MWEGIGQLKDLGGTIVMKKGKKLLLVTRERRNHNEKKVSARSV